MEIRCYERAPRGTRQNLVVNSRALIWGGYVSALSPPPSSGVTYMDINLQRNLTDVAPHGTHQIVSEEVEKLTTHEVCSRPSGITKDIAGSSLQQPSEPVEKKTLTKNQKRNLRRRLLKEQFSSMKRKNISENEEVVCKKPRLEVSTPSPSISQEEKDCRLQKSFAEVTTTTKVVPSSSTSQEEKDCRLQNSFAGVAKTTRVVIVKETFPMNKLNAEEALKIQEEILRRFDLFPENEQPPIFTCPTFIEGILFLHCEDTRSFEWLRKELHMKEDILKGVTLKVMLSSELPKPVKVAFKTKDVVTKEAKDLLRRISRLNPTLKAGDWRVLDRLVEPQSIRWVFEVSSESAKEIKAAGYVAYTGLDRGFFKILRDPNVQTSEPTNSKEAGVSARDLKSSSGESLQVS